MSRRRSESESSSRKESPGGRMPKCLREAQPFFAEGTLIPVAEDKLRIETDMLLPRNRHLRIRVNLLANIQQIKEMESPSTSAVSPAAKKSDASSGANESAVSSMANKNVVSSVAKETPPSILYNRHVTWDRSRDTVRRKLTFSPNLSPKSSQASTGGLASEDPGTATNETFQVELSPNIPKANDDGMLSYGQSAPSLPSSNSISPGVPQASSTPYYNSAASSVSFSSQIHSTVSQGTQTDFNDSKSEKAERLKRAIQSGRVALRRRSRSRGRSKSRERKRSSSKERGRSSSKERGRSSSKERGRSSSKERGQSRSKEREMSRSRERERPSSTERGRSTRAKGRGRSRSNGRGSSKSKGRGRSTSTGRGSSKSKGPKGRGRSKSTGRGRSKSTGRGRSKSTGRRPSKSTGRGRSKSTGRGRSKSKGRGRSKSNGRGRSGSRQRGRSRSRGHRPKSRNRRLSMAKKCGLIFPPVRVGHKLKAITGHRRCQKTAKIMLAAVLQSLTFDLLDIAGQRTKELNRIIIKPAHITEAVIEDEDFYRLFRKVDIPIDPPDN